MPVRDLGPDDIHRIYGPWAAVPPTDVAAMFAGYAGRWWIAGGWAVEAFTGVARPHGDIDLGVPRADLPAVRRHLAGHADLWAADQETLRLLLPQDADDDHAVPESCENVWTRRHGVAPWELDIILTATDGDRWVYKRDPRLTRPLDEVVWTKDSVPYLRPEVQLLYKARGRREKDQQDFDAVRPLLEPAARDWLADALRTTEPEHPWLAAL